MLHVQFDQATKQCIPHKNHTYMAGIFALNLPIINIRMNICEPLNETTLKEYTLIIHKMTIFTEQAAAIGGNMFKIPEF